MKKDFHEFLAKLLPMEDPRRLNVTSRELDLLVQRLSAVIDTLGDAVIQREILDHFRECMLDQIGDPNGPRPMKPSPELMAWAKANFNEEECMARLREIQQSGGLELHEFIAELEEVAKKRG